MSVRIKCAKCSEIMNIDDETLALAERENIPLPSEHTECPRDKKVYPVYSVVTKVTRHESHEAYRAAGDSDGELLATYGGHVESATLLAALNDIEKMSQEQWAQVRGMSTVIEDNLEGEQDGS